METQQQQPKLQSIFLNLSLFQFLTFVRRGIFYTFMINYIFDLMKTVTYTALLGSLDAAASAFGQNLLWGRIADKHKLRAKLVIAGESIAALSYFIVYQIHKGLIDAQANFFAGLALIIGLSILEFFWSMSDVGWAALLTEVTTTRTRARTVGTLNFIASLGRMIGINFAGALYNDGEGFRQGTIFYVVIVMLIVGAIIMWATSRSAEREVTKTEKTKNIESVRKRASKPYDKSIYNWFLLSLIIIILGASCVNQVFLLFIRLPNGLGANDADAGLILSAYTAGAMLISLACGWLADRIGRTRVLLAGLMLAIIMPSLYGLAFNVPAMALVYGLNGVSFWIILTAGFAFAGDIIPEDRRGRLFSRYNAVIALSWGPAGLFIGAPLADLQVKVFKLSPYSAYVNAFYVSSFIVAIGTIIFAIKVARQKNDNLKS